jgi:hypothetical protein
MSSLYKQFKTDEKCEAEGIWLEYGSTDAGKPMRIRVARAGGSNSRFVKKLESLTKPYRRQLQNETMDNKLADDLMMQAYSEAVVLGWENIEDEKGTPIPFTSATCLKLFRDLPDLFADIREQSNKMALYRKDIQEITAKN